VDEEPISEEEEAWGRAYWEVLVARIKSVLDERWWGLVRRITHQPGRSSRK